MPPLLFSDWEFTFVFALHVTLLRYRFGVDMSKYPTIVRVNEELAQLDAFKAAHPSIQRGTSTRIKSSSYQGPGVKELETIAHKGSIKTATALVQTFQDRMRTSPTEPGYASHREMLCYHLS